MRFAAASVTTGGVVALVGVSALLRTRGIEAGYWTDEGIALGIASFPPWEIPPLLAQDGSPPLYFLLLWGWVALVGTGEVATHALSLLIALAAVPVAWWSGASLFGPRTGLTAALIAALHPHLTFYAQETRMHALVVLLSMLAAAGFAGAFALGRRRWLAGFVLATAALLYTHNWGLFFVAMRIVPGAPRRTATATIPSPMASAQAATTHSTGAETPPSSAEAKKVK